MSGFTFNSKVKFFRSIGVEKSMKDGFLIRSVCWPGQLCWCLRIAMGCLPPTDLINLVLLNFELRLISDVDTTRTFLQTWLIEYVKILVSL